MLWELRRWWWNKTHRIGVMGRRPGEGEREYRRRLYIQMGPSDLPDGMGRVLWRLFLWGFVGVVLLFVLGILPTLLVLAAAVWVIDKLMKFQGPRRRRGFRASSLRRCMARGGARRAAFGGRPFEGWATPDAAVTGAERGNLTPGRAI